MKVANKLRTRLDQFLNTLTGIGTSSRDKRLAGEVTIVELSEYDCETLYFGNDLASVIADKLPDEMFRKGFEVAIEHDQKTTEAFSALLDELEVRKHLKDGAVWSNVYGGGAVLLGVDDGSKSLERPLDVAKLKKITSLTTLTRHELKAATWYENPTDPKFGLPKTYQLTPSTGAASSAPIYIHESRLLIFDGVRVTRNRRRTNSGWGDSVYVRCWEVLRDFSLTWGGAANLMSDWAQPIYKIRGLNELILGNDDEVVERRLEVLDMARSVTRAVVLDAGDKDNAAEDFKREIASLAGLPEVLQQFALRLAAAARMPVSLLFGQPPTGLNASDKTNQEWFDDQVAARQEEILRPILNRLVTLFFLSKEGPTGGKEPENWSIRFHPLKQLNEKEEAERRKLIADTDKIYYEIDVLLSQEITESRFGGDQYSADTSLMKGDREKILEARAAKEAELATPAAPPGAPAPKTPPKK